mmetsp:Transcript_17925/g.60123  ORF Transcript_17925/g.60123 Transcript_17925/m.60123 type:complete len:216 (+) Transcript_17925:435-1082(+)
MPHFCCSCAYWDRSTARRSASASDALAHRCAACVDSNSCCTEKAHSLAPAASHSGSLQLAARNPASRQACAECSSALAMAGQAPRNRHHGSYSSSTACADAWPQLAASCSSSVQSQKLVASSRIRFEATVLTGCDAFGSNSRASAERNCGGGPSAPVTQRIKSTSCCAALVAFQTLTQGLKSRRGRSKRPRPGSAALSRTSAIIVCDRREGQRRL